MAVAKYGLRPNVTRVREIVREGRTEGTVILNDGQRLRMSKAGWQALVAVSHGRERTSPL
jgi:two-component system LytT family response regulator